MRGALNLLWMSSCAGPARRSELELVQEGPVACLAPDRRDALRYDRRQTPDRLPLAGANLAGGGVAVEDYDGDGHYDIFLPSEREHELRWGDGADFVLDAGVLAGLDLEMAVGAVNADVDADGDPDLLVTRWERPPVLLRNEGDRRFTDITAASGLDRHATKAQSASWADIDRDEDLDLFIGAYGDKTVLDVKTDLDCSDHVPDRAQLWRNEGDGTFTDISDRLPMAVHDGYLFMSAFYDLDSDGFPELFTAHDDGNCAGSLLLDNLDGQSFLPDASSGYHPGHHDMGMAVGDLNGDELPDFALTSWTQLSVLESRGQGSDVYWVESADARQIALRPQQVFGWGAEFGDLDNDADLDLMATFGFWSYYDNAGDPRSQPDGLWLQGQDGLFSEQADAWQLADRGISRAVVLADLNRDGWLDIVRRVLDEGTLMDLSRCGGESWLAVALQDEGPNRSALGARIRTTSGPKQVRWMQSGSSGLYSGGPLEVHFGLGSADRVDLEIVWPDGEITPLEGVATRQRVSVRRIRPR